MFNNFLPKAIFISVAIHTAIVCGGYLWHMPEVAKKQKTKGVEITIKPPTIKPLDLKDRPIKPAQPLDLKKASTISKDQGVGFKLNRQQTLPKNFMMVDRKREVIQTTAMAHKISVTPIKSGKINNPAYAAYNEMVRSRIESKVYENYHQSLDGGTVYLTFVIAQDGSLKASQMIEERSKASNNLKQVSLKSINDCIFPAFLKGMTLPEYTFNIEIQFQIKD